MRRSELAAADMTAASATSRPRLAELPPRLIQIICPLIQIICPLGDRRSHTGAEAAGDVGSRRRLPRRKQAQRRAQLLHPRRAALWRTARAAERRRS
jgi:hypothetical protein